MPEKPKIIKLTRRKISKYPRLCPECLSILEQMSPLSGWMTPDYYKCQKCGYSGPIGLENSEKKMKVWNDEDNNGYTSVSS